MPSFDPNSSASFAKGVFEFAAPIIVVLGVPFAMYHANSRWATRRLSTFAMNDDEMGFFVAKVQPWGRPIIGGLFHLPCRWLLGWLLRWFLGVFYIATVDVPQVPSLGTVIRAGDDGIINSTVLAGTQSKDPFLSWIPMYEAFFREYQWHLDRGEVQDSPSAEWQRIVAGKRMKEYRREAAFDVWKLKRCYVDGSSPPSQDLRWLLWVLKKEWFVRHIQYPVCKCWESCLLLLATHSCSGVYEDGIVHLPRLLNRLRTLDVEFDSIPRIDRHLLYYPWRIRTSKNNLETSTNVSKSDEGDSEKGTSPTCRYPKDIQPVLVSCLRRLPDQNPDDKQPKRETQAAPEEGQRLRILNGIPAIKISEEDLAAICVTLGIETHGKDFLPNGRGGLGHLLASHTENGMNIIRLVCHHDTQFDAGKSVGSGYSTLFAKHLACGCIPFARSTSRNLVDTLVITPTIEREIKHGGSIGDALPPQSRTIWKSSANKLLEAMPRIGRINYYSEPCKPANNRAIERQTVSYAFSEVRVISGPCFAVSETYRITNDASQGVDEDSTGVLYQINPKTKVMECRGSWWEAVGGIAFGGLAPMTTRRLAELVSWSVGGKLRGADDMKAFRTLMKLVLDAFSTNTGQKEPCLLFGKKVIEDIELDDNGIDVDFASEALGTDDDSIRSITTKLGWLATLLEALVAMVPDKPSHNRTRSHFKTGEKKRDEVFKACCTEVRNSYIAAVMGNGDERGVAELLQEPIEDLTNKGCEISGKCCGTVARCIIMAWASLVRILDWDSEEELANQVVEMTNGDGDSTSVDNPRNARSERRVEKLLTLEDLPDIALWE